MASDMISPTEFAKAIGVSKQAVSKAIKTGRVPAYDETGARAAAGYNGRKFVKPDEAAAAFRLSRARIDDAALAEMAAEIDRDLAADVDPATPVKPASDFGAEGQTLVSAKTAKEGLQADLLRLRLSRERGELVSRDAQLDAFETAGRNVARALQAMPSWAEELNGVAHSGGVPALAAWLRAKANEFCTGLADMMATPADETDDDGDSGSDAVP